MARKISSFQPFGNALQEAEKREQERDDNKTRSFRHATDFLVARAKVVRKEEKDKDEKLQKF